MTHSAPFAAVKWKQNFIIWFIWSNFLCFHSPWAAPTVCSSALLPTPQKSHKSPAKQLISYFIAMIDLPFLQSVFPRYWQARDSLQQMSTRNIRTSPNIIRATRFYCFLYPRRLSWIWGRDVFGSKHIFSFYFTFFQTQIFRIIYFGVVSQNFSRFTRRMNDNNIIIVRTSKEAPTSRAKVHPLSVQPLDGARWGYINLGVASKEFIHPRKWSPFQTTTRRAIITAAAATHYLWGINLTRNINLATQCPRV